MKQCPYSILYEDNSILVVYKQRNVFTIRTNDKYTFTHNLYHYLYLYLKKKNENIYIVHRLDYETSGILIFAKNLEMKNYLQSLFEERKVQRYYEAVIKEKIPLNYQKEVRMTLNIKDNGKVIKDNDGKEAITILQASNYIQIGTALKIEIKTGRKNQIRMAINEEGFTLIGDKRYSNNIDKRMYLNAYHLILPKDDKLKENEFYVKPLWLISKENKE